MNRLFLGALVVMMVAASLLSCSHPSLDYEVPQGVTLVDQGDYILLESASGSTLGSVMFYPGALVDPEAYAVVLAPLAAEGYRVCIVRFPADLAVLDAGKGIRLATSLGGSWVIGGHSLGGVMAANAVKTRPELFEALYFFASWPASGDSLADWQGRVLSLSGELDGLSTPEEIQANKVLQPQGSEYESLPDSWPAGSAWTAYHQIKGANHAQFGNYGPQDGDNAATISSAAQWDEIREWMILFLAQPEY